MTQATQAPVWRATFPLRKKLMHLQTDNGGWLKVPTVLVSTVELPNGMGYETALITAGGTEVVREYKTMAKAVQGHRDYCLLVGVTRNLS